LARAELPAEPRASGVRVPCSTSNLGAGFDCLGLAFDRYLDAGYQPTGGALRLRRGGTLAELAAEPGDDLLVRSFIGELRRRGAPDPGGEIVATSSIPIGRGLGSSAAAVVAGIALASAACGAPLDRAEALALATGAEGHPDNAAPSLFGGLVAVTYADHVPRAMQLPLSADIAFVFAAPDAMVSTQRARAVLPQQVAHSAAVRNTGRMAALLYGLAQADRDALVTGFNDELHVPYRLPLIPGARAVMEAAAHAGAWATTISGSGSGLLAVCARGDEHAVLNAMRGAFTAGGHGGDGFIAHPDGHGAQPRDVVTLMAGMAGRTAS
jgi:homoserine kinase